MLEDYERLLLANEFSEIIKKHNEALERLRHFREAYPYLIAPNIFDALEGNIKDNVSLMYRELQNIHRSEGAHYDNKYICKHCHQIFFLTLPDGLCDKCRAELEQK